jgi:hypothetical protein
MSKKYRRDYVSRWKEYERPDETGSKDAARDDETTGRAGKQDL